MLCYHGQGVITAGKKNVKFYTEQVSVRSSDKQVDVRVFQ